jgi:uncharacterized membrane protein
MPSASFSEDVQQALQHVRYLSQTIGGRGSCTVQERRAGEYAAEQMQQIGVKEIRVEPFTAIPSTYWGYALSFAAALTGLLIVLLSDRQGERLLAMLLNLAGVWGFLAETEFAPSWTRWALSRKESQNVCGVIPAKSDARARIVLCAHLDTHRTPIFYSSEAWYAAFTALVSLSFLSMIVGAAALGLSIYQGWMSARWVSLVLLPVQLFGLAMCLHADFTPYSPGANDNATGVGAALALAQRLRQLPLKHTEIHLAFTGCEEVGDWGIAAYLDKNALKLGKDTTYIILDEVGLGGLKYLTADGLIFKHKTHPRALELARQAKHALPEIEIVEGVGLAYTDALQATKRGLMALTVCTVPAPRSGIVSHWHRMTDTMETIRERDLENTLQFAWTLLQLVDRRASNAVDSNSMRVSER